MHTVGLDYYEHGRDPMGPSGEPLTSKTVMFGVIYWPHYRQRKQGKELSNQRKEDYGSTQLRAPLCCKDTTSVLGGQVSFIRELGCVKSLSVMLTASLTFLQTCLTLSSVSYEQTEKLLHSAYIFSLDFWAQFLAL